MTDNGQKPALERAIELTVFAPIGLLQFAKDVLPPLMDQFVARGRAHVEELQEKVENQLDQARIMGQFAVSQGGEQVKKQVSSRLTEARQRGEKVVHTVARPRTEETTSEGAATSEATSAAADSSTNGSRSDASALPIPDYDELSASQVVARLSGLSESELAAVREYESAGRQRKTILTKIEQLTG